MKLLLGTLLAAACVAGFQSNAFAAPKKLLVITESRGFKHSPVNRKDGQLALSEKTLKQWGQESGLFDTVESQESGKVITPENLKNFDAILFYTTLDLPLDTEQKAALLDFVKNGKAFIGVHSATDTFHNWSGYYEMINGTFDGHPWGAGTTVTVTNHEPTHPCVKMFDGEFPFKDEIYQYKNYNPNSVRVLLSLDMAKTKPQMPYHVPICWVREYGNGRLFYTNLGHNDGTWANPKFREHILAGFRWATKMDEGPAQPNPDVQAFENVKGFVVSTAAAAGKNPDQVLAKLGKAPTDKLEKLSATVSEFRNKQRDYQAELGRIFTAIEK